MKKQNVRTLSFIVATFTYLLIGAAIFDSLESQKEQSIRQNLQDSELKYKRTYNISEYEFKTLEDTIIKFHPYRTFPQWKFAGAFYFSLTVITTIGYGHSTPQTVMGKAFCMMYALVGIPLCLVMFQSVGERLNYFASFAIEFVKKRIKVRNTEVNQTEMVCVAGAIALFVIFGGAGMFSYYEGWTYFNSFYYCVITLTTIGFGDYVALQDKNNLSNIYYVIFSFTFILFGLTAVASSINLLVLRFLTMNTDDERREEFTKTTLNKNLESGTNGPISVTYSTIIQSESNKLEELKKENKCCFVNSCKLLRSRNHSQQESDKNKKESLDSLYSSFDDETNNDEISQARKAHYSVKRAPGQISHLLVQDMNDETQVDQDQDIVYFSCKNCELPAARKKKKNLFNLFKKTVI